MDYSPSPRVSMSRSIVDGIGSVDRIENQDIREEEYLLTFDRRVSRLDHRSTQSKPDVP